MARRRALLGSILLASLACGDEPKSAPGPAPAAPAGPATDGEPDPSLRPLPAAAVAKGDVAFIARGTARLGFKVRGEGTLTLHVEEDPLAIAERKLDARGATSSLSLDLPGTGARPIRVTWTLPAGVEVVAAALHEAADGAAAGDADVARRFAGALAGRSVVVVLADALHAAHLGCYGGARPTSPRLDALAREGVRFSQARAQSAWTIPSVTTLFTGLTQEEHGVRDVGVRLDDAIPTLAEAMHARGYATLALVQNALVTKDAGFARGFDEWREFAGDDRNDLMRAFEDGVKAKRSAPLFAYVHLLPPHAPYVPPAPFATRFETPAPGADGSIAALTKLNQPGVSASDPAVTKMSGLYDNHVAFADSQIATLIDAAVAAFGREKLAVVFLSDHGEAFGQHGRMGHNTQLFDEMVHVPLLFWAPGSALPAGATVDAPFGLAAFPELLRAMVGDATAAAAGTSALQFLSARYLPKGAMQRAALFEKWKLVVPWGRDGAALFDLARDPAERLDVSRDHPVLTEALRQELDTFSARASTHAGASFTPDARLRKEMDELGYTQGGK